MAFNLILLAVCVLAMLWMAFTPQGRAWVAKERQERHAHEASARPRNRSAPGAICPTCGSADVERVQLGTRAASGVAGGLVFSRKARAQLHCRGCGYYW